MSNGSPSSNSNHNSTSRRPLLIEQMEDRILFDAVPVAPTDIPAEPAMDAAAFVASANQADQSNASVGDTQLQSQQQTNREVVFVDKGVENYQDIVADFAQSGNVDIFLINGDSDGLEQIAGHLEGRTDISAIHIVSHGDDAQLRLGNATISAEELSTVYRDTLANIGSSLSETGDILIYGCQLAQTEQGDQFIESLADLTGADIAASDDLTGLDILGGDWELEKSTGTIEANTLVSNNFQGVLITADDGFVVGTSAGITGEVAVTPVDQGGTSSKVFTGAATSTNDGVVTTIDLRLTLVNTFDPDGNITNGTAQQLPVTFSDFTGAPVLLARTPGASVNGFEGHTAEILVEYLDNATGQPLSVVGEFTFTDIDFEPATAAGSGSEAVTINADEIETFRLSDNPPSSLTTINNGDDTLTFTNLSDNGGAPDNERWVDVVFEQAESLTLVFQARNANTGYGLSTQEFTNPPIVSSAPQATDDSFVTDQDTPISGNIVTGNNGNGVDSDSDNNPIFLNAVNDAAGNIGQPVAGTDGGVFTVDANGSYTFDPNGQFDSLALGETATTSITYRIQDSTGLIDSATVTVVVTGTNDAPVANGVIADQVNVDNTTITPVNTSNFFSDPDANDSLTFSADGTLPPGLSIDPVTGIISGTLDNSASVGSDYSVVVSATDSAGAIATRTFTWTVTNPAPTATNNSNTVTEDSGAATGNVIFDNDGAGVDSDPDGDTLTVSAVDGNASAVGVATPGSFGLLTLNSDGTYSYQVDNSNPSVNQLDVGQTLTETFEYAISDGEGGTAAAVLTITINGANDAPIVGATLPSQTSQDSQTISPVDVSTAFNDPEGDSLTFAATSLPPGLSIDPVTGLITGTIDSSASQSGPFDVVITATDDNGDSVSTTFQWTVTNPAPVAVDDNFTTDEDTAVSGLVGTNDNDVDGDSLSFTQTTNPTNGSVTLNPDGSFTYVPDGNFNGTDSFDYLVTDADGATSTATVNIVVDPVNDAPVVDTPIPDQANLDSDNVSVDVSNSFSDLDGDTLNFTATDLPPGLSIDPVTGLITGTIDSSASANGPYTVTVTADDGNGGLVTDTFLWTVTNPAPIANDDTFATSEDVPVSSTVATNDNDPDGDALTFAQLTNPANGTVVFNTDGTFTYTPDANFVGTDTFDYQITDADGLTSTATATINVGGVNDAPVVDTPIPDQANLDSDNVSVDVSNSFSDLDGDTLNFTATDLPPGLSIDPATGLITGTIDSSASANGPYTVTVTADDGNGGSVTDTFVWTVTNPAPVANDDTFTTAEDQPVSSTVATNDSDPDGDALTFAQLTNPTNGTVAFNTDGTFTYTPDANFVGTDSFDYQITDADGLTSTATATINVGGVNDAPVVDTPIPDQANLDSDNVSVDVSNNFSDLDGDTLNFTATDLPPGLSIDPVTGLITGTIDSSASANGPYTVTVTADDGNGGLVTDTFVWTVTNPAPVANDDGFVTGEDTPFSNTVATNDSDPDGDALTFAQLTNPANGTVAFNTDGTFTYTPDANFVGTDSFDYLITDADGQTATATVTIDISPVNDAPVSSPIAPQTNQDSEPVSVDVSGNFSDPEGDPLTFSQTGLPPGLSIDPVTGLITGTIDSSASQNGPYTVTVTADDGNGGTVEETFVWTVTNPAPVAVDDNFTTDEDTAVSGLVGTNDNDVDGDSLSFTQTTNPTNGSVTLNPDGSFTYVPDGDFNGTDSFDYLVTDADGATSTATVNIVVDPVNDAPVVDTPIADQANLDSDNVSVDVSNNFSDLDGDTLNFTATDLPPGLSIDPVTGLITGTIDSSASANGPYTVTVTADDGNGGSVTDTFVWTVTNPAPVANDDTFTTAEDQPVSSTVATNDSDPDGDALTFAQLTNPANGTVVFNNDGTFTYTPDANFVGTDSFDYQITDADGLTSNATATINVGGVNDAPVVDTPIADQANLDSDNVSLDVSNNFSDLDGDTLSFTATDLPPGLSIDPVTGLITGTIDSSASANGPYTVTVTADDGNGGSVTDTFVWTVTNPAPVANDDTFATSEDVPVSSTVATNDNDPDGDALTFAQLTNPTNGTVVFNNDGTFTYTPDANFVGTDSFDYQITDADGLTSTATATINVGGVNDAPVVDTPIPDQANLDSDNVSVDVSNSFSDLDGDTLNFTATDLPPGLSIDPVTGLITGTIDSSASANGPYTVTVTADDGNGGSVTDTFVWTVTNPAPVANDDTFTTSEDVPVSSTVATNDNDPDGDALTFAQLTNPANGTVVFNTDGTFTYTPDANFVGTDTFDYQITDADGLTSTATATINVGGVNDAPVVDTPIADQANLDSDNVSVDVSNSFSDLDGDTLSFTATDLPPGLSIDPVTGLITGTIDSSASANGPYTVTVTADDGNGGSVTDTFVWTVTNPAPVANDDTFATSEDVPVSSTVATNDNDPDGDALTFAQLTDPTNGTVVFNTDGTFTYTPDANFSGSDTFDYLITDADGQTATATVTIDITPVNDAPIVVSPVPDQIDIDSDSVSVDVSTVFADVDGDVLTFAATGLPTGLTIDPVTGLITGTLDSSASQDGPFTVTVTANDGNGGTVADTFTWTVTNPAPEATNDSFSTIEDTPVSGDVSGNDTDPDGDALTFAQVTSPANGSVVFNADGTFEYTPNNNFVGVDTFDYTAQDADGAITTATVTISVGDVNDPPVVTNPIPNQFNEDAEVVSIDVSASFDDAEGDTLTFAATGLPPGLTLDSATGVISGTIDNSASLNAPYTVVITADDGNGGVATDSFEWTISNPVPVAADDFAAVTEDVLSNAGGNVLINDIDPDGDNFVVDQIDGNPADVGVAVVSTYGTVQINGDGSYTYQLDNNNPDVQALGDGETLTETFVYQISDGEGGTDTAELVVTINGQNDAPQVAAIPAQENLDTDVATLDVSNFVSDPEGDVVTFAAAGLPQGLAIDPVSGVISGTIDGRASTGGPGGDGVYTVSVTTTDENGAETVTEFVWTVNNLAPVASDDNFSTDEDVAVSGVVGVNDSDPDNDPLTYSVTNGPTNGSLTFNPDGSFTYTPDVDYNGTDSFDYLLTDADGDTSTATVTLTIADVNDSPVVTNPVPPQDNLDGETVAVDVSGSFADPDGTLTFSANGLPPGLTIDADGNVTGTIDTSASQNGPYTVSVTATDDDGATVTETFVWTVTNPAPVAVDDVFSTDTDVPVSGTVATNDSDPDGDSVSFVLVTPPANGTVTFSPDGSFTYVPDAGFAGNDAFDYQIVDADGLTADATAIINVSDTNEAPQVVNNIPPQSNLDADNVSVDTAVFFNDADGDPLVFSSDGLPPGLMIEPLTGTIVGTIDNNASANGPYTVTVTATDGDGETASSTFVWTVDNPAPVANDDGFSTDENTPFAGNVGDNDVDPDGDDLTFAQSTLPVNGDVVFNADGSFTYTPDADFSGTDTFDYTVTDAQGATVTATVVIDVNNNIDNGNNDPVAVDDAFTTVQDTPVSGDVSLNDNDVDGDELTYSLVDSPSNGTLNLNPDGTFTYSPDAGFFGDDTFTYSVDDGNGGTATAVVQLVVSEFVVPNEAPTANDDVASTDEDTPVTIDVVSNDSDPENGPLTVVITTPPTNGTVVVNPDGSVTYVPDANYNGPDSFEYEVCDAGGLCDTAVVSLNVNPVNDVPVAVDDAGSTDEGSTLLLNLTGNDFDPEGLGVTLTEINGQPVTPGQVVSLPSGATVTINADGTAVFNPNGQYDDLTAGQSAIDTFTYTIVDADGQTATADSVVTINGFNENPVAQDDFVSTLLNTPVTITPLGNDFDPEGQPLDVILLNTPDGGTAVVNDDGTVTFTPDPGFIGTSTIHYLIEDPDGGTSEATITVEVTIQFAFDSFTNQAVDAVMQQNNSLFNRTENGFLSQKIFTLAPEPIFSGFARPGTQIVGRIYDQSGSLVGEGTANTDPGGNWMMQIHNTKGLQFYRIEFEHVTSGVLDVYGYLGLNPADNTYQAMEALTTYDRPMSVEGALATSEDALLQAFRHHNDSLGFGVGEQ